ncbi:hypothetical protein CYMTET_49413 [Cymbomonas tetramitiformis]|uniref:FAD dependent oxidoreductase domain-containing protein n=1 Tax=Cymbomonas tetramitiformis TaxID=36881 RepID=A0AAE0BRX8_9CHLO|nr:hypothetical protein CYMTET_49413 [Cymbomonas tetramitiformis]
MLQAVREGGATIRRGAAILTGEKCAAGWTLGVRSNVTETGASCDASTREEPEEVTGRFVVNAAGLHADRVQAALLQVWAVHLSCLLPDPLYLSTTTGSLSLITRCAKQEGGGPGFEIRPRKGQYVVYSAPSFPLLTRPIQPVPSQRTKGVFLFPSVHGNIVVGPTAEDVTEREMPASTDAPTTARLQQLAERLLPRLTEVCHVEGTYAGLRPATQHRDYQIAVDAPSRWVTVAGIRSTGLSGSQGIGRYVASMIEPHLQPSRLQAPTASPYMLDESGLRQQFLERGDGCVELDGVKYRVTHPLTRIGWSQANLQAQGIAKKARL